MANTTTQAASDATSPPPSNPTPLRSTGTQSTRLCSACNKPGLYICSLCRNARYCSRECQEKDFGLHKLLCKSFAELGPRPGPKCFRGIFFPADDIRPRFVWNEYHDGNLSVTIKPESYVAEEGLGHYEIEKNRTLKRMLGYRIGVWYDEGSFLHLPPNFSLEDLVGRSVAFKLRGPFLAHGYQHLGEEGDELGQDAIPLDLDTAALANLKDGLKKWVGGRNLETFPDWDDEYECWERPRPGGSTGMNGSRN